MPGISVGSVSVNVTPNTENFASKLRSSILPAADALGAEVGRRIADGINAALHDIRVNAIVDLDTSAARAALDDLGSKSVSPTIGLDDSRIVAALDEISVKLDRLDQSVTDVRLTLEDAGIGARLDEISLKLDEIGSRDVSARLSLDDSSFNRQLDEDMAKLSAAGSSGGGGIGGGLLGGAILGAVTAAPALPGVLTGGGAAIGTLGLAVQGIGPALSAYTAAQTAAATATGKTGAAAISASSQIHSAQQAVSAAETTAAHDAVTSAESIKNAHTAVAQAVAQAAQSQTSAEQTLANAQYAEKAAQQALTDARQQAILTLQQLNNSAADASLNAEQAQLDLTQAKMAQRTVDASLTSTALQRAQADLSVREAEQRLKEAQQQRTNSAKDAAKADKEGVNGLPAVVAAQHNLAQAHQATGSAQRALVLAEQQGAAAITKAQQGLADAVRNASWQQKGDATSVSNAQYGLKAAYAAAGTGSTSAATAAAKYAAALAGLSPGGRQMVKDIIGLKSGFDSLKTVAQGAIAPGFTAFVKGIHSLLPAISTEVQSMGSITGGALSAMGQAFQTSGFQATLKELFAEGNQFLQIIGPAIGTFLKAFGEAGAKSGPAVTGLAKGLAAIVTGLGGLMTNLAPAAGAIGSVLQTLGQAIGAVGGPLGTILGDLVSLLAPLLSAALPLFKTLLGDIVKVIDPLAKALLPVLAGVLKAIGPSLNQAAVLLGQFAAAAAQVIIALLPILPPLVKLAVAFLPILLQQISLLIPVIKVIAVVLAAVVSAIVPVVTWVANVITAFVNWITSWNEIKATAADVASFITHTWSSIYQSVSGTIGQLIGFYRTSWNTISSGVKSAFSTISSFITGSWNTTYQSISKIVGAIVSFLSGSWNKMVTDAKNIWNGLVNWITSTLPNAFRNAFQGIVNGIASVWNTLQNIVKVPINFLINKVYDGGIVPVVDAVAGLIGMHPLTAIPGLAAGGKITAGTTGTADDVLARVSKNETVVSEEHSLILAPAFAALGVPGYAEGGIPNPIGFVQHEASSVWKSAMAGLRDLTGDAAAKAAHIILDPLVNAMPGGGTPLGADIKKIPVMIVDDLIAKIKGATVGVSGGVGGGSGADVAKYAAGFATGHGHPYVWGGSSPSGWDCCIIGSMEVQTSRGPKRIIDVTPDDDVYSWEDGKLKVARVVRRSAPRRQMTYRLRTNHREITASGNHPFLTLRSTTALGKCEVCEGEVRGAMRCGQHTPCSDCGKPVDNGRGTRGSRGLCMTDYARRTRAGTLPTVPLTIGRPRDQWCAQWTNLEDLRRGDIIVALDSVPDENQVPDDEYLSDPDFLWLLGVAIGDGNLSRQRPNRVDISVYGELREQVHARLEAYCGKRGTPTAKNGIYIFDARLAEGLRRHGLDRKSIDRIVPPEMWVLPHGHVRAFLAGYTAADGHTSKRPHDPVLSYNAASEGLIRGLRNLHMILGHNVTRVREQKRTKPIFIKGVEVKNPKSLWCFGAYVTGLRMDSKGGGFWDKRGIAEMFPADSRFTPQRVLAIDPVGDDDTYDITVEGTHNFVAEGLVVHNSGFSADMYEHFGYFPEKEGTRHGTSQSQFSDPLLQSSGAVPGALAFFNGSDGPIGHVGIALNPTSYVSAYDTAEGTVVKPSRGALGYRIPKGGFQVGGTTPGSMSASAISALWTKDGGRASAAGNMARIAFAESRDVPGTVQKGQPPGLTGYGLYQITPTSGITQNGKFGNLLNASNNTKAAISLYNASGYSPWASDPVAKALLAAGHKFDNGGWMPPGLSLNLNGTGRPEPVLSGAQWDALSSVARAGEGGFGMVKYHKQMERVIHLLEQAPARTAGGVGGVINGSAHSAVQRAFFRTR